MQLHSTYDFPQLVALIASTLIGTSAYLGFLIVKKKQKVSLAFMWWTFMINLFIAYVFSEVLRKFQWGEVRTIVLPIVAYLGQYLTDWVDRRYPALFDAGARKAGLDIRPEQKNDFDTEDEADDYKE
ncbi:MAG: hypothetical protein Q4F57_02510 [Weeksellaceae bacterium]|nr:hypothetical protein [Weeksellaceae bacterium]